MRTQIWEVQIQKNAHCCNWPRQKNLLAQKKVTASQRDPLHRERGTFTPS